MDIHVYVHIHAGWKDISSEVVGSNESVVLTRVETNKEQPSITMSVVVRDDFSGKAFEKCLQVTISVSKRLSLAGTI